MIKAYSFKILIASYSTRSSHVQIAFSEKKFCLNIGQIRVHCTSVVKVLPVQFSTPNRVRGVKRCSPSLTLLPMYKHNAIQDRE